MPLMNMTPALAQARRKFSKGDAERMSQLARVFFDVRTSTFDVPFLSITYKVKFPDGSFNESEEVELARQILVLHYLTGASGLTPSGKLISFKEFPGGSIYDGPFATRAIRPLIDYFGSNPRKLIPSAAQFSGVPVPQGDHGICIQVFPLIPVTLMIWEGDDEFPASGNILFDATAPSHMTAEDYAVLAEIVVGDLKLAADKIA